MGILDQFRTKKEEKKAQTTPPPQGHTLAQIMQDRNKSHLFGELLKRDDKALAERFAGNKLTSDDIDHLETQRKLFSEKIIQSEKIEAMLTSENVINFARTNPEFEKIINLAGPEKAAKAIKNQLREISISDEDRFKDIVAKMNALEGYKNGQYKQVNDCVEKLLKQNKISEQEYFDVLAIEDPEEKEAALRKLSTKKYGKFKKALDWVSGGSLSEDSLEQLRNSETAIEDRLHILNTYEYDLGSVLFSSVSENENIRGSFFGELMNEKPAEKPKTGFKEAKSETFDETEFNKAWEAKKTATPDYAQMGEQLRDIVKQRFIDEQQEIYREKNVDKGFWAQIFATITESLINIKKSELK